MVFTGDTALISERDSGNILELTGDTTRLVGTVQDVRHVGESGLLGLAVDEQQRLYAYSTGPDGNRIQRFAVSGSPGSLRLGAPETILAGLPAASCHDGDRLAFGPDGMLYATVGDAGQRNNAQDLASLGGKILRMTSDGGIPADNPFPGSLVYSYGHRNPQGIAWDSTARCQVPGFLEAGLSRVGGPPRADLGVVRDGGTSSASDRLTPLVGVHVVRPRCAAGAPR
jgi:glucose/arabinose dehydrogenase